MWYTGFAQDIKQEGEPNILLILKLARVLRVMVNLDQHKTNTPTLSVMISQALAKQQETQTHLPYSTP